MSVTTIRGKLLASAAVCGLLLAATSLVVFSAFSSVTRSEGNTFNAGSITVSNNSTGSTLFAMSAMKPGSTQTRCVKVSYVTSGALTSTLRLYGATTGTGLASHLSVKVIRGADTAPAGTSDADKLRCVGFAAATVDFPGPPAGAGVLFDGKLSAYPASYETGIVDPNGSWAHGDSAVYQIQVTLDDTDAAQGKSAGQEFAFQARNS